MPDSGNSSISIVIPAYNEEKRIGKTLVRYIEYYDLHYPNKYEIVVVLNGCKDDTESVVKKYADKHSSVSYLNFKDPIGKGGAIKKGLLVAKYNLVGFTDADSSTPPMMMDRLFTIANLIPSIDCVIGSRRLPGSVVTGKNQYRKILSWGYNLGANILFGLGFKDTQCGAKVVRKSILENILPLIIIPNMAFDVNLLMAVKKSNHKTLEIPIDWEDSEGSTISGNSFKTSFAMAVSTLQLRLIHSPINLILKNVLKRNLIPDDSISEGK